MGGPDQGERRERGMMLSGQIHKLARSCSEWTSGFAEPSPLSGARAEIQRTLRDVRF
jgi:hypothetical protein